MLCFTCLLYFENTRGAKVLQSVCLPKPGPNEWLDPPRIVERENQRESEGEQRVEKESGRHVERERERRGAWRRATQVRE